MELYKAWSWERLKEVGWRGCGIGRAGVFMFMNYSVAATAADFDLRDAPEGCLSVLRTLLSTSNGTPDAVLCVLEMIC